MIDYYKDVNFLPRLFFGASPKNGESQFAISSEPEKLIHPIVLNDSIGANILDCTAFASNASLHMIACRGGELLTSSNGIKWNELLTTPFGILPTDGANALIYTTKWVAVGSNAGLSVIYTSTDNGGIWVQQSHPFVSEAIISLSFVNNLYIAVGSNGMLATSPDAITWTSVVSNFGTSAIKSVAYTNALYIIVGDDSKIATSADAITWTLVSNNINANLNKVIVFGNMFLIIGESGTFVKYNGTTFIKKDAKFSKRDDIKDIIKFGSKLIAIGTSGNMSISENIGDKWMYLPSIWKSSESVLNIVAEISQL